MNQDKRELRRKTTAEVFTPSWLVNQILDKLPEECCEPSKTFCDPACGNGNMLIEVFRRKVLKGSNPSQALSTIYGVDIMADNIQECRKRLLYLLNDSHSITREDVENVFTNIVLVPLSKYPLGSLSYDFSFGRTEEQEEIDRWYDEIQKDAELFLTTHEEIIEEKIEESFDLFGERIDDPKPMKRSELKRKFKF
jgi:hypothetical protein